MRYVIVSVIKGPAGDFNNNLRKKVLYKFKAKSSKLPAHFTIKSPFEADDINELDNILTEFCNVQNKAKYTLKGYDHFDDRVVFMKVFMSEKGSMLHDNLIDRLDTLPYIHFNTTEGKDKVFHVTIASKKIQKIFDDIYNYVNCIPYDFECFFDNISVFQWNDNTWKLYKEYLLK